jgi:cyanophycinase
MLSVFQDSNKFRLFGNSKSFIKFKKQKSMPVFDYAVNNTVKRGYLVLIGGAEDRKNEKTILKKVVSLNNAKNIVIIPSASNYPKGLAEDYFYAFSDLGVANSYILDVREKSDTGNTDFLEKIQNADLIFFTGGDQYKLVNTFLGTFMLEKIKERYMNGATIAGTSAGAAAACDPIIFDGDSGGLRKGTIHFSDGFGFIKNITIDTHFVNRGRLGRLTQFLSSGLSTKGIGIGEDTALIIDSNDIGEVIGSEMVTVVNTGEISYSNYKQLNENDPIVINDIRIGFLQSGSIFDLKDWKVVSSRVNSPSNTEKVRIYN